ncbi:aspartate ammonia-lyase [Desulfohalobiaceae bacterium Ax17]|uniref:aspartate ammonia-lyase n=1 Tax=Desulfovulcanus ferrireducens TaxID=2831190 RepID=UPI00207BB413|nr:aspartate ammonia-lyase [Desulfovulcanus ferrireducens]MBT8764116.1 aspartate ammonia-lyase [Desulfovulcanus ferrireducens]
MIRIEHDLLGEKKIPRDAYFGIHSLRAKENFPLSGLNVHPELIRAMGLVKQACARANLELGYLKPETGEAIISACEDVCSGKLNEEIVVDALQGGAGTSTNMNINEVIANRAIEILEGEKGDYKLVHPINQVNLHQSTNDVYPTAIKIAAISLLRDLEKKIAKLQAALQDKENEFRDVIKIGRTELQDAVPMTLGAEFSAFSEAIARDRWRVFKCEERLRVVNIGGTAIGTGLTAPRKYIFLVIEKLREQTGFGLARAENMVDATQNMDAFVEVSGILKAHAVNLFKISSDLRLMSSGPLAGLREIKQPEVQAGSSIMPGKVNPVICEAVGQVAIKVMANDFIVTQVCQNGQFELNPFLPLLAHALLESLSLLIQANKIFREKCIQGISANKEICAHYAHHSPGLITALLPYIGYEQATSVAKEAQKTGKSVLEIVREKNLIPKDQLEYILSPEAMTALGYR